MNDNNYQNPWDDECYFEDTAPLIETEREYIKLERLPRGLDFTEKYCGTVYTVKSFFNPDAEDCIYRKVSRMISDSK